MLLAALATVKRVGDLQAFSVDDSCLEFGPGNSHVVLRPRPGYVPKVPTTPFRDQVVNLQALTREEADPRTSDQLLVCFGGQQKGKTRPTKTRPLDSGGYSLGLSGPVLTVPPWCESTLYKRRCFLLGLARGASITDICKAAGWVTPNTFARFYNLRIEPVSSRVLVSDGR